ncbi:MAG TPA: hypothetical protein VGE77_02580 [Nocardioides sp.]
MSTTVTSDERCEVVDLAEYRRTRRPRPWVEPRVEPVQDAGESPYFDAPLTVWDV